MESITAVEAIAELTVQRALSGRLSDAAAREGRPETADGFARQVLTLTLAIGAVDRLQQITQMGSARDCQCATCRILRGDLCIPRDADREMAQ